MKTVQRYFAAELRPDQEQSWRAEDGIFVKFSEYEDLSKRLEVFMNLSREQSDEFRKVSIPLIEFLSRVCDPHAIAIVDSDSARLMGGVCGGPSLELCVDWGTVHINTLGAKETSAVSCAVRTFR